MKRPISYQGPPLYTGMLSKKQRTMCEHVFLYWDIIAIVLNFGRNISNITLHGLALGSYCIGWEFLGIPKAKEWITANN